MPNLDQCSQCGAPISLDAPRGLCTKCLFSLGLSEDGEPTQTAIISPETDPSPQLAIGNRQSAIGTVRYFGDYELLEEIARGGMGIVFKARQVSLNRMVALKLISAGRLATEDLVKRFKAEAEAAASLAHPNIVPIFEIGEHEGQHYFSMGLIEGPTLREALSYCSSRRQEAHLEKSEGRNPKSEIKSEPPHVGCYSPKDAARLLSTIARAVHYAHQRGVLHRDLKPSNILLDSAGEPHLTDFGLAKLIAKESTLTHTNAVMGTPAYMSPEQARGETRNVTTAADAYGLGAVLYETLTGSPPFGGGTSMETIRQVLEKEPRPPSRWNPAVDRDLETICLKCLEKDPSRRYASAEAVAEDLDRWLGHEPIAARPNTPMERIQKWVRRRPAIAALSAAAGAALIVGLSISTWQWRRQVKATDFAQREQYRAKVALADTLLREVRTERARETLLATPEHMRHWEWGFLMNQAYPVVRTFTNHSGSVNSRAKLVNEIGALGFSSDGTRVLSGDAEGSVKVWDLTSGRLLLNVQAERLVYDVILNAERNLLVATGSGGWRHIWDASSGTLLHKFDREGGIPALSADGLRFALCKDGHVRFLETETRKEIVPINHFPTNTTAEYAKLNRDGSRLIFGDGTNWTTCDTTTGRIISTISEPADGIINFSLKPNGKEILFTTPDANLVQYDLDTRQRRVIALNNTEGLFSPDGSLLAARSNDGTMSLYDTSKSTLLRKVVRNTTDVFAAAFSPDNRLLVTGGASGLVEVWPVELGLRAIPQKSDPISVAASPDGRRAVVGCLNHSAVLIDLETGVTVHVLRGHFQVVLGAAFTKDGRLIATASYDHTVKLWDTETVQEVRTLMGHTEPVHAVAFAPDGKRLYSASADGSVRVWDVSSGQQLRSFSVHTNIVWRLAVSPDGKDLLLGTFDHLVKWINAEDGAEKFVFPRAADSITAVGFQPNGPFLAAASADRHVRIWHAETRALVATLPTFDYPMGSMFSSDGKRLFVVSSSNQKDYGSSRNYGSSRLEIWDTSDWTQTLSVSGKEKEVYGSVLTGSRLLTVGNTGNLSIWEAMPWRSADFSGQHHEPLPDRLERFVQEKHARILTDTFQQPRTTISMETKLDPFRHARHSWPGRNPNTPASAIDLTEYYNARLDVTWYPAGSVNPVSPENNMARLPTGMVTFAGTTFDIRGLIQLVPSNQPVNLYVVSRMIYPSQVKDILVKQHCSKLHFLHAASHTYCPTNTQVAGYVLHYHDGSSAELPVIADRDVDDWWYSAAVARNPTAAQEIWTGTNPILHRDHPDGHIRLFLSTRANPTPEKEVTTIDFVASGARCSPFLVAITIE